MNQTLFSRKESEDHSPVLCTRNSRVDIQRLRFANHRLSGRARFLPLNTRTPEERPHSRGDPAHEAEPVRRGAARVLTMSPPRRPASHGGPIPPTRLGPHAGPSHAPAPPRPATRIRSTCSSRLPIPRGFASRSSGLPLSHFFRTSSPGPVCP